MRRLPRLQPAQWRSLRTTALTVAGFGCLTAAAWVLHLAAGLAAAGVALLLLDYLADDTGRRP